MKQVIRNVLSLLFFCGCSLFASAQPKLKVVTEQWPPYNYIDETGNFKGLATERVLQIVNHAGFEFDIQLYAWNKSYKLAKENPNTLLFTVYRLKQRENDFQWICPLIETGDVEMFVLGSRNDIKVSVLNDAMQHIVGTVSTGSTYDHLIANGFKPNVHLDIGSDEMANVKKLLAGRIDIIIQQSDLLVGRLKRANSDISKVKSIYKMKNQGHNLGCMAMSHKTSPEIVNRLRQSLAVILKKTNSVN